MLIDRAIRESPRGCVCAAMPLFMSSGDLIADRRYRMRAGSRAARRSRGRRRPARAGGWNSRPALPSAWFALGEMRRRLGDRAGAVAAFERARAADPRGPSRRGGAAGAPWRGGDGADAGRLCARAVRPVCAALRPGAGARAWTIARRSCCSTRSTAACDEPARAMRFGTRARSRLRHRARRRGVPPACRLAGRRRSVARHDRAGAPKGLYDRLARRATCWHSSRRRDAPAPHLVLAADVFVLFRRSRAAVRARWRACWRRWRAVRLHGRNP